MTKSLARMLTATFRPEPARRTDPHRKHREQAKRLAKLHGVEIEQLRPGYNVWPPRGYPYADPCEGDHYCHDWEEVLGAVRCYTDVLEGVPSEASRVDPA